MVSYGNASFVLFVACSVASAHKLPAGYDIDKFPAELKKLRMGLKSPVVSNRQSSKAMKGYYDEPNVPAPPEAFGPEAAAAFLDNNEFIAPGPDDSRGPCPFINAMANHGFINRNGQNIPVFSIPALGPVLFDFPEEMFTRPANQAIFDGQADVQEDGEALLSIVRLWDRPGEERDISQVFPNPGIIITQKFEINDLDAVNIPIPQGNQEMFIDFRYNIDESLLAQLLSTSDDGGVTLTQANHNQHLRLRLQDSL